MCSPSRSTLMTGYFPAQHGVKYTLEANMPAPRVPAGRAPHQLQEPRHRGRGGRLHAGLQGQVPLRQAGERHGWVPADVNQYGFTRWDPPDAGADQSSPRRAGGEPDNDGRFMNSRGQAGCRHRGRDAVPRARSARAREPFFMVVSLVNPHDVLFYPQDASMSGGYDDRWLNGEIALAADGRTRTCRPSRPFRPNS